MKRNVQMAGASNAGATHAAHWSKMQKRLASIHKDGKAKKKKKNTSTGLSEHSSSPHYAKKEDAAKHEARHKQKRHDRRQTKEEVENITRRIMQHAKKNRRTGAAYDGFGQPIDCTGSWRHRLEVYGGQEKNKSGVRQISLSGQKQEQQQLRARSALLSKVPKCQAVARDASSGVYAFRGTKVGPKLREDDESGFGVYYDVNHFDQWKQLDAQARQRERDFVRLGKWRAAPAADEAWVQSKAQRKARKLAKKNAGMDAPPFEQMMQAVREVRAKERGDESSQRFQSPSKPVKGVEQ